jgi:Predicted nucleotide-binding protein containing TIR-like domain
MTFAGLIVKPPWKIKILSPKDKNLTKQQNAFRIALNERLVVDSDFAIISNTPERANVSERYDAIRDSDGTIVLAFEQWAGQRDAGGKHEEAVLPSEFAHISIVQSDLSKRPYLILREKSVDPRGALRSNFANAPYNMPKSLDPAWLKTDDFNAILGQFLKQVRAQCHVFLGYSSQAKPVAGLLLHFLRNELNLRVLDWHDDFQAGLSIWEAIGSAEKLTHCGMFLFMEDDLVSTGKKKAFAPRDNVVFEAGYFAGAKGKERTLIVREKDAKIPSDFGGILLYELPTRENLAAIEPRLKKRFREMFGVAG